MMRFAMTICWFQVKRWKKDMVFMMEKWPMKLVTSSELLLKMSLMMNWD